MTKHFKFKSAVNHSYWLDTVPQRAPFPTLKADISADIAIIGGGFVGLWSALNARERFPDAKIVILEGDQCGAAASGRNGGFCAPSISHGISNAKARWPEEAESLVRLGRENLDGLEADLNNYGIDAEFERKGKLNLAAKPWQVDSLRAMQQSYREFGVEAQYLDPSDLTGFLNSPAYLAGLFEPNYATVNPMKIVEGLCSVTAKSGTEIYENSRVNDLKNQANSILLTTDNGSVIAKKVIVGTNAAVPIIRQLKSKVIPIFDYTLVTEPLSQSELESIGWEQRYGIADAGNQFHYSRKTADNRILWGGYDAIYHYGSNQSKKLYNRDESFARLEEHFFDVFPSLADIGFSHAWGGVIDTSARTTFFSGTLYDGKVAYASGFTGQGVSASRFAALTMLDHLENKKTESSQLRMHNAYAVPFPPEPIRYMGVKWAQHDLAKEDLTGKRSLLLKTLDQLGIGFNS